jgi:putative heme-binding domain-containing protein
VGPDLVGNGRSSLDSLLHNIIDPNQVIGRGYENVIISTKDGRTVAGRVVEDTPTQVKLVGINEAYEVVPTDQIAKRENTVVSLMPEGFGSLPDDQFRNMVWYLLAPPEEGPLTPEKKAALAKPVTETEVKPKRKGLRIDWESVSLWNPEWKVTAPEFEGTPVKLTEYRGRKNVLQLHPFEQNRKNPAKMTREWLVDSAKPGVLKFSVANHEKGDFELRVVVNGKEVKREMIKGEGWTDITVPLEPWKGQKVNASLENWANDWNYEFSHWADVRIE